ncbi:MAG: hypothetical protein ACKOC4_01725 [Planctomycetia bacterium]
MSAPADPSGTVVHEIRWSDALPWWLLFRAAGAAFAPTVILLAAAGAVATWAGWSMADRLGLAGVDAAADVIAAAKADDLLLPGATPGTSRPFGRPGWLRSLGDRLPAVVADLTRLVAIPFRPTATLRELGGAAARIGWFLLVWSIFGTAIARHVALKLVGEDAPGVVGATWFGSRKWLPAFNSVLFVLVGVLALSVPGAILGLAMRTSWGLAFAGAVWPLVLLGAVVLAILVVGVVAGWPLMVACVGVERGDSFQAISTAFSYLYQRPLHYAFYALVALLVAIPSLAVAALFADATASLAMWATSFGMGHDRTAAVLAGLTAAAPAAAWGARASAFWNRGLETLLSSFGWGYFWAIATAAYLLLRQDVDGTELDEVVLDEPAGDAV